MSQHKRIPLAGDVHGRTPQVKLRFAATPTQKSKTCGDSCTAHNRPCCVLYNRAGPAQKAKTLIRLQSHATLSAAGPLEALAQQTLALGMFPEKVTSCYDGYEGETDLCATGNCLWRF